MWVVTCEGQEITSIARSFFQPTKCEEEVEGDKRGPGVVEESL